jgi:class 3 adenylate cyclase/tetratricopeptide (TPR) repeat protein
MAPASRRERKVVSVVFCDLVGFTQRAERLDPEDVEALLDPYHRHLRSVLEHYGGTVEKFIGDAVMALFGAPVAHEDDPERAVRAALAIRDWALEQPDVQVRLAVTSGEALIRLDARPEAGEGMASGDVVNTAARLQSAAPVNGILVDEGTYRATRNVVEYSEHATIDAKGKAEPVAVWQPHAVRSRFGVDVAHEARRPLVGRARELDVLRDAFARARDDRAAQLVTLVGVPGIGKSRLVYELSRIVDADPELITWRQGRCLAYGDGITLWAFGEIVKAQAGIVEQDEPDGVRSKLEEAVANAVGDSDDGAWVLGHLLALVGLGEESELGGDRRGEAFAAWRRFLEGLADERPLVLVFEDLHWADESLLDFVDELVDWITDVPLLVVATARPELLERRPGWGGGKLNSTTLALRPLSDDATARLIAELLETPVLPAESQQALLQQAGGNPLYAEQFADLYLERGSTEDLPLPETLQGLIAARLDGLRTSEKELLQDAAVVGKVFWPSALQGVTDLDATLHALERKGFVRRQRRSSLAGESELAFAHALVRDVAYGQIARGDRAAKHRHVALWIESLGRPDDHAELLAHHWSTARELAEAAGLETTELVTRTRLALRAAGDRSFALNGFAEAATYYQRALALWPDGNPERADVLLRRARSLQLAADERSAEALEEARDALLVVGDREAAAEAEVFLSNVWWHRGRPGEALTHLDRAEELSGTTPSPVTARVLAAVARTRDISGNPAEGLQLARGALAMAEELGLDEIRAHALTTIGTAKGDLHDPTGRADLEAALEIALAEYPHLAGTIYNNLAVADFFALDLRRTAALFDEGLHTAERFGDGINARWLRGQRVRMSFYLGHWDEALEGADAFIAECDAGSPHYLEVACRETRGLIRLARFDVEGAREDLGRALARSREIEDPQSVMPMLSINVLALEDLGEHDRAATLVAEVVELARRYPHAMGWGTAFGVAQSHAVTPFVAELQEIANGARPSPWKDLVLACLERQLVRGAEIWAEAGSPTWEAHLRLRAAQDLFQAGRQADAETQLELAVGFYRTVGATFYVSRAEELLAASA